MSSSRSDQELRAKLCQKRAGGLTWDAAAKACEVVNEHGNPDRALAHRIAHGYIPHKASTRMRLRLTVLLPAAACVKCGQVHVRSTCTQRKPLPAWVTQVADFLQERQAAAPRVYGRGGRKVRAL